jgi:hypothetical protein
MQQQGHSDTAHKVIRAWQGDVCSGQGPHEVAMTGIEVEARGSE